MVADVEIQILNWQQRKLRNNLIYINIFKDILGTSENGGNLIEGLG